MVKEISRSIREYKKAAIATPVLVSLEVVMECIIPFLTVKLVGELRGGCDLQVILNYGLVLVGMALLCLLFGWLAGSACAVASCGLAKNLRGDMFHKIQTYSFENIDKYLTSSLVTRLTTDVTNVQNAYMMIIRSGIRAPLMIIFAFIMAFVTGGQVAWIFMGVVPLLIIGLGVIVWKALPIFKRVFRKYDNLNASVQENVKAMRVVKSFVREDFEEQKFDRAATDVCHDFTKAERLLALNNPMMQFCLYVVMVFLLSFGSYVIVDSHGGALNVEAFTALLAYGFMMLSSLMMLSMIFVMVTMALESGQRISEILREESTLKNPENPLYEITDGSVDFENVDFKYSAKAERRALAGIDLHISSGETVGIIGGTGSGKTSLVNLISRLYDATTGEVKVGGKNVKEYDLDTLRNGVAVVLQKNELFSGTIKENLRWGNKEATDEEIVEACRLACADEFIRQFPDGYDTFIEQGGTNVSGGQKQRLCIARALLKKPKILILDDSTSAVDTKTDATIRKAFREYIPETTKFIIAQRTASVEDADRIIVMEGGRINAVGTHARLLESNSIYREIYTSQNKAGTEV